MGQQPAGEDPRLVAAEDVDWETEVSSMVATDTQLSRNLSQPPADARFSRTFGHVLLRGRPRSRFVRFPAYGVMEVAKGSHDVEFDVAESFDRLDVSFDPPQVASDHPAPAVPVAEVGDDGAEANRRYDPRSPLEQALSDRRAGLRTQLDDTTEKVDEDDAVEVFVIGNGQQQGRPQGAPSQPPQSKQPSAQQPQARQQPAATPGPAPRVPASGEPFDEDEAALKAILEGNFTDPTDGWENADEASSDSAQDEPADGPAESAGAAVPSPAPTTPQPQPKPAPEPTPQPDPEPEPQPQQQNKQEMDVADVLREMSALEDLDDL